MGPCGLARTVTAATGFRRQDVGEPVITHGEQDTWQTGTAWLPLRHNRVVPVDVDFSRLRPWGRGQDTGFEELCCQIVRAQAASRGNAFVRLGAPDGGVEGYETATDGEHGIQAKFFLGKPTTAQWGELTKSVKRAIDTHPRLVELTIALPSDRQDPRRLGEQWFMDEWNMHVESWHRHAEQAGRTVAFQYMGKSEIADALSLEEHAGRYRWWFDKQLLSRQWLEGRLDEVISQVGPRYNRDLTVDVAAGRKIANFARVTRLLTELDQLAITVADNASTLAAIAGPGESVRFINAVARLPRPVTGAQRVSAASETPPFNSWLESWKEAARAAPRRDVIQPTDGQARGAAEKSLDAFGNAVETATSLLFDDAPAYQAPAMLIWGDAGAGKTHLLCDTAVQALERGQPAVVVLGQQLGAGQPWTQVLEALRFEGGADDFLQALSARAEAAGHRALLLIDAINENNGPALWPDHLAGFLALARRYPWVGVVLSIRTTAVRLLIPKHILEPVPPPDELEVIGFKLMIRGPVLLPVRHTGFAEDPFTALSTFFDYYGLPLPAAPVGLYQELANPLMLRLYCQAATRQPGLLSRPLPGLTRIVDAVLHDIDDRARVALGTDPYQEIARPAAYALAAAIRQVGRAYLTRPHAAAVVSAAVPFPQASTFAKTPLAVLISESLLTEDVVAENGQSVQVVRFAFERIGDHLSAQEVLARLGLSRGSSVQELGKLADLLPAAGTSGDPSEVPAYRLRSMLEALAVLLPEQLGLELQDLVPVLDASHATAITPWVEQAWLAGLQLREASSFTAIARQRLAELVTGAADTAAFPLSPQRRTAIRISLALSVHADQPLGPGWLHAQLQPMTMPERDRRWTAQIRGTREMPSPFSTLIAWCRAAPGSLLSGRAGEGQTFARMAALALMWALPSPDRFLRDSASRALVALADQDSGVVTDLLQAVASVDDEYVTERVLAVACAAVLRGTANLTAATDGLGQYLERHGLPVHVLARDYLAVTVHALAKRLGEKPEVASLSAAVLPPYPADWPGPLGLPQMSELEQRYPAFAPGIELNDQAIDTAERETLRRRAVSGGYVLIISSLGRFGDFHRYVMHADDPAGFPFAAQRLDEPLDGQPLHDFDTSTLLGWVFGRVLQMGWSPETFGEVDFEIDREMGSDDSAHKRERFGKKYQWLVWHEALARLSATQRFRDDAGQERAYQSAWQLQFIRDFDPTHLLNQPESDASRHWRDLWHSGLLTLDATVASSAGQDGPVTATADSGPDHEGPWWFPAPHLPAPAPPQDTDDPLSALSSWATDSSDLPDLAGLLVVRADLETWVRTGRHGTPSSQGGRRYRLLAATEHLLETAGQDDLSRPDILASVDSVLIRQRNLAALDHVPDRIEWFALDVTIADTIFLGEWPKSPAYSANFALEYEPRSWPTAEGKATAGLGIPAVTAVERYVWEGVLEDCSLPATLTVHLLGPSVATMLPGLQQRDGLTWTAGGQLFHLDPDPSPGRAGALVADEELLAEALMRDDLVLLQIIRQRKRVNLGLSDDRFTGQVTATRMIASIGSETLLDISGAHVEPPRLT
jgi:hypothetical protein